ncbi:probable LRR receptor-like serine/threonine-protein kinase RFK1 [Humulus lupulus]|uniref:probable LRR receptor-like serine/threonine-protein kinase RFK1 n=1 Tax=Humulus lupulus TaxID=3486 RepID=UPI002B4119C3|nr:probable LRR receptor-like serine/threonine-protein kinase RFK1 [Humulus lupulus]
MTLVVTNRLLINHAQKSTSMKSALESNLFSGTVPSELGKLVNLTYLNLNANNLTGEFPLSLTNLSKLSVLRISSNNFTGSMPEFSGWKQLQYLEMEASGCKGPIPSSISSLDKLIEMYVLFHLLSIFLCLLKILVCSLT